MFSFFLDMLGHIFGTHLWNDDRMDGHGWLPRNWDLDLAEALIRKTGTWRRAAQPMAMIQ